MRVLKYLTKVGITPIDEIKNSEGSDSATNPRGNWKETFDCWIEQAMPKSSSAVSRALCPTA